MQYQDLKDLYFRSSSSRRYFLSLPVSMQIKVSEHGCNIHSAADLHKLVSLLEKYDHAIALSDALDNILSP